MAVALLTVVLGARAAAAQAPTPPRQAAAAAAAAVAAQRPSSAEVSTPTVRATETSRIERERALRVITGTAALAPSGAATREVEAPEDSPEHEVAARLSALAGARAAASERQGATSKSRIRKL